MFLEKINNLLLSWVDQGIFSEFWYYIQEFSNYEIIISLRGLKGHDYYSTEDDILIGRLTSSGYYDLNQQLKDKKIYPFTSGRNFNHKPICSNEHRKQEYEEFYGYRKEPQNGFINVGILLSRKIDEIFWLLLKSNKMFEPFIGTLQWNVSDNTQDCDLLFSSSTYLKDFDENYRSDIFGVDCEELDNYLDLSTSFLVDNNKKFEEILNEFKDILKSEQDRLNIDLLSPALNSDLSIYEDSFSNNIVDEILIIDYRSLIERFMECTFNHLDKIFSQNLQNAPITKSQSIIKRFEQFKSNKKDQNFFQTRLRFNYLYFLNELCHQLFKGDELKLQISRYDEIKMLSNLDFYRNQRSHGTKLSLEKKIYAIKGYRFILKLLSQYFQSIKNILN